MKKFVIEFGPKEIGVALAHALVFGGDFAPVQSFTGERIAAGANFGVL